MRDTDTNFPSDATPPHAPESTSSASGEVTVEKWVYGGRGLGRSEGQVILLPFVLPGETVRFEPQRTRPGLVEARLVAVTEPATNRIPALCPYFQVCGGCDYQHAPYAFQLEQKKRVLSEVFQRVGKFEAPAEIPVVFSEPWHYRNRAQLHVQNGQVGYHQTGSHRLCAITYCPISSPKLNQAIQSLQEMVRHRRFPNFVESVELFTNEDQVLLNVGAPAGTNARRVAKSFFGWAEEYIPGASTGALSYPAASETFRVSHHSFFQVNRHLIDALVEAALQNPDSGQPREGQSALDLYAGVGLFSIPLARRFQSVTAVESSLTGTRDLTFNAEQAGLHVTIARTSVDLYLQELQSAPDFVLADPPRGGLGKFMVKQLLRLLPRDLTIVSCDPATLARDLAPLLQSGYQLRRLILIDLFPQTFHMETVVHLGR
jgi:23S rRNA (uracil1939-C5)-methyltransferase